MRKEVAPRLTASRARRACREAQGEINPAPKPRPGGATRRLGCLINEGSEMPDKYITLNGHLYRLVEDGGSERLTAAQIHERTGKSIHAINAAMKEGRLAYSVPNGCKRPRMASWQAVAEWMGWE